jgi:hypothetical protein
MELPSYHASGALNFDMATRFLKIVRPTRLEASLFFNRSYLLELHGQEDIKISKAAMIIYRSRLCIMRYSINGKAYFAPNYRPQKIIIFYILATFEIYPAVMVGRYATRNGTQFQAFQGIFMPSS